MKISITGRLTPKTVFIIEGMLNADIDLNYILIQTNKYRKKRERSLLSFHGYKYLLTYLQNYLCFYILKMPTTFTAFFKGRVKYIQQLKQHNDSKIQNKYSKFDTLPHDYYSCLFRIKKIIKKYGSNATIVESNKLCGDTRDNPIFSLDIDVLLVIAGGILGKKVINHPSIATLTLHNSILPRYRGWGGAESWALYDKDISSIGQTIFFTSEGIDVGDILFQKTLSIEKTDTIDSIIVKNIFNGLEVVIIGVNLIESGNFDRYPQDHTNANYINRRLTDKEMAVAINNISQV